MAVSLRRAAGGVSLAVLASRILGLVREVLFAGLFGAGRELDAFVAAFRIPNLLRDLFAEGALSAAFVSTFSRKLEREGTASAWRLAALVTNDLLLVVGAIVAAGIVFCPFVVSVVAPGFQEEPGKFELTVFLARILFPFLLFVALAAVAMGILNARSRFWVPALASSFFNLGFRDPGVIEVLRLMGPATVGIGAVQLNVVVNTIFASGLGDGAISWLNAAFRVMYLPIGMFGVALGTVTLPAVSRAASRNDFAGFRARLLESLRLLVLLCIPAAVGLAVIAEPLIGAIYEHGRFGPEDTRAAAAALIAYSAGLTGYATIKILGPAFYALQDARTPMFVSLASVTVNLFFNWAAIFVLGLGHAGLAGATALVATWNALFLWILLRRRIHLGESGLAAHLARTALAALVMALACLAWRHWLGPVAGFPDALLHLGTTIPVGVAAFGLTAFALGIEETRFWRSRAS